MLWYGIYTVVVEVTGADLANGVKEDPERCPVALAARRSLGWTDKETWKKVFIQSAASADTCCWAYRLVFGLDTRSAWMPLALPLARLAYHFDRGDSVEPDHGLLWIRSEYHHFIPSEIRMEKAERGPSLPTLVIAQQMAGLLEPAA